MKVLKIDEQNRMVPMHSLTDALQLKIHELSAELPGNTTDKATVIDSLDTLQNSDVPPRIISIVGAGGKTNTAFSLAKELGALGYRAAITTTTHMMSDPEHGILVKQGEELVTPLPWDEHPYLLVTAEMDASKSDRSPSGESRSYKTQGLSAGDFRKLKREADVLIVEADGARRLPFKVPAPYEPVIPEETDTILILMGLSALGNPIETCVCRTEVLHELLKTEPHSILSPDIAAHALYRGYIADLSRKYPAASICVIMNQADTEEDVKQGEEICSMLNDLCRERSITCLLTTRESSERV